MAYTDLTTSFTFKSLLNHQKGEQLLANDNFLVDEWGSYRRPNLIYIDNATIDVENNVPSNANSTKIIFPDGDVRTVEEDTSLTHQYRRLIRTATHSLTVTHDSGAGNPSSTLMWIAIYAVKTTDDASKFVLVGSNTMPSLANYATLNTAFGTNGWVYLGLVVNGDGNTGFGFLDFKQTGPVTLLKNTNTASGFIPQPGFVFSASTGSNVTYTYFEGSTVGTIPAHLKIVCYGASIVDGSNPLVRDDSSLSVYEDSARVVTDVDGFAERIWIAAEKGIRIDHSSSENMAVYLNGFIDNVLACGSNPEV